MDTLAGTVVKTFDLIHTGKGPLCVPVPPVQTDMALAITRIRQKEGTAIQQISMNF
jgi:hypothetical protein